MGFMNLNKAFQISWRLAVLALPWQTRWFAQAPSVAGWPWEQGCLAFYASWIPMVVAIALGMRVARRPLPRLLQSRLFWLFVALGAVTVCAAPQPIEPAVQWWLQVTLLLSFFVTLLRADIPWRSFVNWFVISLIPHAILAVWQFRSQEAFASKWLGIAAQHPATLGTSVVQTAAGRFLRAYGGFPHPNILGGWMAVGMVMSVWLFNNTPLPPLALRGGIEPSLSVREGGRFWRPGELVAVGLFTIALFYSFSRGAWLAAAIGISTIAVRTLVCHSRAPLCHSLESRLTREKGNPEINKKLPMDPRVREDDKLIRFVVPVVLFLTLAVIHRTMVFTRLDVQADRLEQKSVVTRLQSLRDGVRVYQAYALFGTGPNGELSALAQLDGVTKSPAPLEPPHMVWLIMMVNFGTVGALFILGFALSVLRRLMEVWNKIDFEMRALLLGLVTAWMVLATFDHYLWSLWSGLSLSAIVGFVFLLALSTEFDKKSGKH